VTVRRLTLRRSFSLLAFGLALLAASCPRTLAYRAVQDDFETAVLTDGVGLDPGEVAASLDDERIARLEPELRSNAWLVRAYAEWRDGALDAAEASAKRGVSAGPVPGSRDDVLLLLLPALLVDSQVMADWKARSRSPTLAEYRAGPARDMATALLVVTDARGRFGPSTPEETEHYVAYQEWRLLQNWREIISHLPTPAARNTARDEARHDGRSLREAAAAARGAIPPTSPLYPPNGSRDVPGDLP
jgi:hypothetical protein